MGYDFVTEDIKSLIVGYKPQKKSLANLSRYKFARDYRIFVVIFFKSALMPQVFHWKRKQNTSTSVIGGNFYVGLHFILFR
ncbi:hypothetical protein SAMN05428988_3571 [Chitinophaga sp. YR573]|nr:hypothetical protein SAMN05428988_3571 [Chitinophaga sp. YR573]